MSQVHTVFGCEPNRLYCAACAKQRHHELTRDASRRRTRECDHCHQLDTVVEVSFAVAAVVVRTHVRLSALHVGAVGFWNRLMNCESMGTGSSRRRLHTRRRNGPLGRPPWPARPAFRAAVRWCGAPTRRGTPCQTDAATCGWHKAERRARAAPPSNHRRRRVAGKAPGVWLAASNRRHHYQYVSKRLRHLNGSGEHEWDGGPDGDGGEPLPVTGT